MLHRLDDLDDPRLADYRSLKTTNLTRWSQRFIAEGRVVVDRLLASGLPVRSLLLMESIADSYAGGVPEELPVLVLPDPLAEQLVGFSFHQGILACAERPENPSLEKILDNAPERWTRVFPLARQ